MLLITPDLVEEREKRTRKYDNKKTRLPGFTPTHPNLLRNPGSSTRSDEIYRHMAPVSAHIRRMRTSQQGRVYVVWKVHGKVSPPKRS